MCKVENPFKKTRWCAVDNWFEANIADFEPLESQGPMSRCRLDQRSYVKLMRAMERRGYRGDNSKSWAEKYREIFENGLA
ncbi:hypothetical protein M7I_6252 [Glarea lozoyensis 74030]|uniref:Uncharacterized protein n=1 Tax=Glarea lozoyensis (strain ATCC 74030 / MF5533) TaxID=1104152 RepID=H0EU25_GLAL7|nr:hypothetical protein M7I_6252 [Glarea lozoyensis 74030]